MRINLINPMSDYPSFPSAPVAGARAHPDPARTSSSPQPAIQVDSKASEIRLIFPPDRAAEVDAALDSLGRAVGAADIALNFSRDEETGAIVVKMVDQTSGETVQQIPAEALLHLSAALGKMQGQLFNQRA
ncbi:MAG: flagellar protein FlaG [Blastocatellia bacterium]|nr:flagellar protein FlaG [Blastocatellia bacterium]